MTHTLPTLSRTPAGNATRREFLGILAAAGLLAGCGSDQGDPVDTGPRTVVHEGGPLTLEGRPSRVVVAGPYSELDALLALGVDPVGIADDGVQLKPYQLSAGAGEAATFDSLDGPNLEALAALRPDLAVMNADTYAQLPEWVASYERLCPLVGLPVDLDAQLDLVAQIFDVDTTVLADAKRAIQQAIGNFAPRWRPESVAVVNYYSGDGFYVWTQSSGYASLFGRLGLPVPTAPPGTDAESQDVALSLERIGELDKDLLIVFDGVQGGDPAIDELEGLQLFQNLRAVRDGRYARVSFEESYFLGDVTALTYDDAVATLNRILS